MSNENIYSNVEITEKIMFIESIVIPSGIEYSKTYNKENETCTLLLENVSESSVNSIKRSIAACKAKFYGARSAVSIGKIGAKVMKSTFEAAKAFGKSMKHGMEDVYEDSYKDERDIEYEDEGED